MLRGLLLAAAIVFAVQALRAKRLLTSTLWLAGLSAIVSMVFYLLGARQVAVIELSIGAGLVTVLFVFAISVAGDEPISARPLLPAALAVGLPLVAIALLGWLALSLSPAAATSAAPTFTAVLWQQRGLDVLAQIVLIFSGVLGLLGLLAEAKAPLDKSMADAIIAQRNRDLLAIQQRVYDREKERDIL
jgi:NADH:ubiquinone oxidoreductase subunit 6 (subunit J)